MNEILIKLVGTVPIMLHNNQTVNPLNRYAHAMKTLTGKRKKTEADYLDIARVEWEAGLYIHDGIIAIPGRCVDATFKNGAKRLKEGKRWLQGAMVMESYCPLEYKGKKIKFTENGIIPNPGLDEFFKLYSTVDIMKVGQNSIVRTRPIFQDWSLECTVAYDENIFDMNTIKDILTSAGRYIGLCEGRPRNGKFEISF